MKQGGLFGEDFELDTPRKVDRTAADRVARSVAARAEIGPLPECLNAVRREAAGNSIAAFGVSYCMATDDWGGLLIREPSEELRNYAADLQSSILGAGFLHIRLPRSGGKTTWAKIALLWGVVYGHLRYPVLFGASDRLASSTLDDIWELLEFSPAFGEDFPEVAVPVRMLDGKFQRAQTQTVDGERTAIRKTHDTIAFPRVAGSAASGAMISARGAGAAVRGLVRGSTRPDFALLDDIQTREDALSAVTTGKLSDWIQGDVLGLAGARQMAVIMTSTPIVDGDLSSIYSDQARFPAWRTVSHPLVRRWPDAVDDWDTYADMWRDAMRDGDPAHREATRYYEAHRERMDAGASVFDPGAYDGRVELSAIQHAVNLRLRGGEAAFEAEYQLNPPRLATVVKLTAEQVKAACNGAPRGVLPAGTLVPLAFVDVMADAGIMWSVIAFGPQQVAAVIDYGRWPERGRLVPENAPPRDVERAVAQGVAGVLDRLLSSTYQRAGGGLVRNHAVWIDHGWQTRVLVSLAALYRGRGHSNVWTCKGWPSAAYGDGTGRNVVARGWQVDFRERDGTRFAAQNSDHWRETAQRAFLGLPLQPGTISLWGDKPAAHGEFADHMSAETLADKAVSARGVEMYRWTSKPGAINHWLDTTSGCLAAASWYRFWDSSDVAPAAVPAPEAGERRNLPAARAAQPGRRKWRSAKAYA